MSDALYHKGLLLIAHAYAEAGQPEDAMLEVMQIPVDYFRNEAPKQMRADVEFFQKAARVYRALSAAGYNPFEFNAIPMKPAKA